jgi:hypothetical protein
MLRQSITGQNPSAGISSVAGTLNEATQKHGVIGTSKAYAVIHNFGGEIRPTRAKALAIPATPEASKVGSPRNFPKPLAFIRSKGSKAIGFLVEKLARKGRSGGKFKVQYVLMRAVTILKRKFMPTAADFSPVAVVVGRKWLQMVVQGNG